jgi:hypothetical protein
LEGYLQKQQDKPGANYSHSHSFVTKHNWLSP